VFSCSNEKKIEEVTKDEKTTNPSKPLTEELRENVESEKARLLFPSKETLAMVDTLERNGDSCKFFFQYQDQTYYIVKGPKGRGIYLNADSLILPLQYNKVYNPGMTHDGCLEIKTNGKLGLLHLASGQVLKPQFEYIAPKTASDRSLSYGFLDGQFYEIVFDNNVFQTKPSLHNIAQSLSDLDLQFNKVGHSILYDPSSYIYESDAAEGNGWVFLPSYLEVLQLWKSHANRLLLEHHNFNYMFGINESRMQIREETTIGKITSFILETYEQSWDARSSTSQSASVLSVNGQKQTHTSLNLLESKNASYPTNYRAKFIKDDLLELYLELDEKGNYYDVETVYRYFGIDSTGSIKTLDRPRHFDFTYFVPISANYFQGLFGTYSKDENGAFYQYALKCQEHLSIKDLDVMRNEIYAEYGYRFKSKEWQEYFSQYDWYEPRFDNVDDQLTTLEKDNINVILAMKEKMAGKEAEYLQLKDSVYHFEP